MATNGGNIVDEPHKTFDTILTLDFGLVTLQRARTKVCKTAWSLQDIGKTSLPSGYEGLVEQKSILELFQESRSSWVVLLTKSCMLLPRVSLNASKC